MKLKKSKVECLDNFAWHDLVARATNTALRFCAPVYLVGSSLTHKEPDDMKYKPEKYVPLTDEGKLVKTRKEHRCYHSGRRIEKGEWCESSKIMPNSSTGDFLDLKKPKTFYFCLDCAYCTH